MIAGPTQRGSVPNEQQLMAQDEARLAEATRTLREVLQRAGEATTALVKSIETGTPVVKALGTSDGLVVRDEVNKAFDAFQAARHQLRLTLASLSLEQGASVAQIGRALGISRQLAARLAAEARRPSPEQSRPGESSS